MPWVNEESQTFSGKKIESFHWKKFREIWKRMAVSTWMKRARVSINYINKMDLFIYISVDQTTKWKTEVFFLVLVFIFIDRLWQLHVKTLSYNTLQFNEYLSPNLIFHKHASSCCPYCKFLFSPSTLRTWPKATTCNLCTCL